MEDIFQILIIIAIALFFSSTGKKKKKATHQVPQTPDETPLSTEGEPVEKKSAGNTFESEKNTPQGKKQNSLDDILETIKEIKEETIRGMSQESREKKENPLNTFAEFKKKMRNRTKTENTDSNSETQKNVRCIKTPKRNFSEKQNKGNTIQKGVNLNNIDEIRRGIIWSEILKRKY